MFEYRKFYANTVTLFVAMATALSVQGRAIFPSGAVGFFSNVMVQVLAYPQTGTVSSATAIKRMDVRIWFDVSDNLHKL
jgi:hypothetical protein